MFQYTNLRRNNFLKVFSAKPKHIWFGIIFLIEMDPTFINWEKPTRFIVEVIAPYQVSDQSPEVTSIYLSTHTCVLSWNTARTDDTMCALT